MYLFSMVMDSVIAEIFYFYSEFQAFHMKLELTPVTNLELIQALMCTSSCLVKTCSVHSKSPCVQNRRGQESSRKVKWTCLLWRYVDPEQARER